MSIDPAIAMAVSVESQKGIYALLLGSGISRSAGIPTGWELTLDLIQKLAAAENEDAGENPEDWYEKKYSKKPDYSDLILTLAPTPSERHALLKSYFEPTDEEREQGLKVPTDAHKAIARLVATGHISVIVTTNFDQLLETSIKAEGINPIVVYNSDQIEGMMPLVHSQQLIVKVHGHYLDTRFLNTPEELKEYPQPLNELLDQIFSDYGLIVCGWSGEWDDALRSAILRNTRYRFSTYWMAHGGKIAPKSQDLAFRRHAITTPIEGADQAFIDLAERVEAISQQRMADPSSPRVAVAMAKRFLSSDHYRIEYEDLIMGELKKVLNKTNLKAMPLSTPASNSNAYTDRASKITTACATLAPLAVIGNIWGGKSQQTIWSRCVKSLANQVTTRGLIQDEWRHLRYAPAAYMAYAACMGCIISKDYSFVKSIFIDTKMNYDSENKDYAYHFIEATKVFPSSEANKLLEKKNSTLPGTVWLYQQLELLLADFIPTDMQFEDLYYEVEYTLSLVCADVTGQARPGYFMFNNYYPAASHKLTKTKEELQECGKQPGNHHLLASGLFDGEVTRLEAAMEQVQELTDRICRSR